VAQFRFLLAVIAGLFIALPTFGDSVTHNGVVFFDTSLGTLHRVTVTVDPPIDETSFIAIFGLPPTPVDDHEHVVTFPPFTLPGRWVAFPPVTTSVNNLPTLGFHTHTFDLPPIVEVYEGDDVTYFIFNGMNIIPGGYIFQNFNTSESEGHVHSIADPGINYLTMATTTFEYMPIPEPATAMMLLCLVPVAMSVRRRRF
jgi:hypothetical protein